MRMPSWKNSRMCASSSVTEFHSWESGTPLPVIEAPPLLLRHFYVPGRRRPRYVVAQHIREIGEVRQTLQQAQRRAALLARVLDHAGHARGIPGALVLLPLRGVVGNTSSSMFEVVRPCLDGL